ncbi:hypothetical protein KF840_21695 [bacterium]|nr:hypothetical protein [bacterium]
MTHADRLAWPLWDIDAVAAERMHLHRRLAAVHGAYTIRPVPGLRRLRDYLLDRFRELDAREAMH